MDNPSADHAATMKEIGRAIASYTRAVDKVINQVSLKTWALVDLLIQKGMIAPAELESAFEVNGVAMMVDLEFDPEYLIAKEEVLRILDTIPQREG